MHDRLVESERSTRNYNRFSTKQMKRDFNVDDGIYVDVVKSKRCVLLCFHSVVLLAAAVSASSLSGDYHIVDCTQLSLSRIS
jgi:hypothetical protein